MLRVLVIDDENHVRAAVTTALKAKGYDVRAFATGPLGLRAFDEAQFGIKFDVAIVDVFMLEMDGMTTIKALRERAPTLPIVVISGGDYGSTALDILPSAPNLSSVACLQKPFRPPQLVEAIEDAIRKASETAADQMGSR